MRRWLPAAAVLLMTLIGLAGASVAWSSAVRTDRLRFAAVADEALNRVGERVRLHVFLIEATAAIIEAQGDALTAPRFEEFYNQLRLSERYPGIAGIGYAPLLFPAELPALAARLEANYNRPVDVWPPAQGERIAPVVILQSPDAVPPPAIGFDMFSDPVRRAAMTDAITSRAPRATEPLKLATDAEPTPGFIVYAPIYRPSFGVAERTEGDAAAPTGFAFGGFRTPDLTGAALNVAPALPVAMILADADEPGAILAVHGAAASGLWTPASQTRHIDFAGQSWVLEFHATEAFHHGGGRLVAMAFGGCCIAFGALAAIALREQGRAYVAADALVAVSERNLAEKDLLLQEMTHRIKNAISRILAIARRTAEQSPDLATFEKSFSQRLRAMAEAQDMVTRSASASASLRELLERELAQVFGPDVCPDRIRGPAVELNASRAQALGLVFHELATNALKYGELQSGGAGISVSWSLTAEHVLDLEWVESGAGAGAPQRPGFGTKLIDALIRHELDGAVERTWAPEGLRLRLRLPLGKRPVA